MFDEVLGRSFLLHSYRFSRNHLLVYEFDPLVGTGPREFAPHIREVDEIIEENVSFPESDARRFDGIGIVFRGRDASPLSFLRDVLVDEV